MFVFSSYFPAGDFAGASDSGNDWSPKTGYSSDFSLGFKLRAGLMISLSGFFNRYTLTDEHQDILWDVSGFSIGPMFGFSLTGKTHFDLIPRIGFVDAHGLDLNNLSTLNLGLGVGYRFR